MARHTKRFTEGMLDDRDIMRKLELCSGQTIVDAGCGNGYMSMLFSDEVGPGGLVYALDVNAQFIKEIQAEITADNIRPMVADIAQSTPLPDGCADVVYIATVLHSVGRHKLESVADEVRRLLAPGGLLGVVEIAKHATQFGPPQAQRYAPEELRAALPFTPVSLTYVAEHFYLQVFTA
jgi:ubiquinone/menaquinone biosynthesis C-methylase UbiE